MRKFKLSRFGQESSSHLASSSHIASSLNTANSQDTKNIVNIHDDTYSKYDNIAISISPVALSKLQEVQRGKITSDTNKYHGAVMPIEDEQDILAAQQYFLSKPLRYRNSSTNRRNYALFTLGCNCARRIGDLLHLKVGDILTSNGQIVDRMIIKEQKTGKSCNVYLNTIARSALSLYMSSMPNACSNDPLFKSRKKRDITKIQQHYIDMLETQNMSKIKNAKHRLDIALRFEDAIEPSTAWSIYKEMSREIGLEDKGINVGTHSTRKTWACNALHSDPTNPDMIVLVSEALNHSDIATTRRYVGITQKKMDNLMMSTTVGESHTEDVAQLSMF